MCAQVLCVSAHGSPFAQGRYKISERKVGGGWFSYYALYVCIIYVSFEVVNKLIELVKYTNAHAHNASSLLMTHTQPLDPPLKLLSPSGHTDEE